MLLKTVMNPDVLFCEATTTIARAAGLMREAHVGDLVVVDNPDTTRSPIGVITDRDIVVEIVARGLSPTSTTLDSIIRKPVILAHEAEDTVELLERMRAHGVRRVPVVDARQRLTGIITLDDLLALVAADCHALVEIVGRGQAREHRSRR